jgi:hypothetical protein
MAGCLPTGHFLFEVAMGFIKAFFDDKDTSVNPAHVVAATLVIASIGWVTYLVLKNHVMPDLTGIAYLLGGSGAMNIAQKAGEIVEKFRTPSAAPAAPIQK